MAGSHCVNCPRLTTELAVGASSAVVPLAIFLVAISGRPPPRAEGWVLLALITVTVALAAWLLLWYLRHQRTIELTGESIEVTTWWDRWRHLAGESVALSDIHGLVWRRPSLLDIETTTGHIRLETTFWAGHEERELQALATAAALPFRMTG